ncbi:MAG: CBS domain-containing protein [Sandaracinaceae bacterium]
MTHREITVADLMSTDVFAMTAGQSMSLAESAMRGVRLRHIPVVDSAFRLVGLITHRDILMAKVQGGGTVLVADLMQMAVCTVSPDTPAMNAARLLQDHRFGCLPVVEEGRLVGIVTEHDFLSLVTEPLPLRASIPPAMPTVTSVMSPLPITLRAADTVANARDLMDAHGIRHLPIVDADNVPVGLISDRDLQVAEAMVGRNSKLAVRLLGSAAPFTVEEHSPLGPVLRELEERRLGSALVVDGGRLTGIVTTTDVCRLLGERL